MIFSPSQHIIKYNISTDGQDVCLRIWEPAPITVKRVKPYLFSVNYRLPSEESAKALVNRYLIASGASAVEPAQLPRRGHLKVLPNPTDEIWL